MDTNTDPIQAIQNMVDGAKGLIGFVKQGANDPNLTPEQREQIEKQLKQSGFYDHEKSLNDLLDKFKNHYGPNSSK
jgi:hypothetical protein